MAKYTSDEFQQYHQGDREYCRESGPLKSKAGSFPPMLQQNGLGLISSAAVILVSTLLLLPLLLTSRVTQIGSTDARVLVDIQNRPADQIIRYVLSPAADPELTVDQGILASDAQTLTFQNLTPDTDYLVCYYTSEEGADTRIGQLLFRTLPDPTVLPTEPVSEPTVPLTEPTDPPTEPTEPPTEPTEPPTEPTEPPTEPTEPPAKPTVPPTRPTEPPTEPTEPPTEPTEPPTEPTEPPEEDASEIFFTDIAPSGYGYGYTVNAKFANLADCVPVSAAFYREIYYWYWNESEGETLVTELADLAIDEDGTLLIAWDAMEEDVVPREQCGHRWRVVLTYIDESGAEQTMELTDSIEPLCSHFNNLSGTLWKSGDTYYLDYTFYSFINPYLNPGDVEFDNAQSLGWNVESAAASRDGDLLTVTGRLSTDNFYDTGLNTYWIWTEIGSENPIYSGCGGGDVVPFTSQLLSAAPNADGTGYTDVLEEHTFQNGATTSYGSLRIHVTLADGTVISLAQGETDPTGQVRIIWDEGGNLVVTVAQAQVAAGSSCTVERIVSSLWEDSGDRNITVTNISRSSMYYSSDSG